MKEKYEAVLKPNMSEYRMMGRIIVLKIRKMVYMIVFIFKL